MKFFVFISRNYNEYKDIVDHILLLRKETESPFIIRYLNDLTNNKPKLDDRFYQVFKYIPSLIYNHDEGYIRINEKYIDRIINITSNFEKKLKKDKVPFPLENGERGAYEEMLYNPKPFWE